MNGLENAGVLRLYEPFWGEWYLDGFLGEGSYGKVWRIRSGERYAALKQVTISVTDKHLAGARAEGLDEKNVPVYFRALLDDTLREVDLMRALSGCSTVVRFDASQVFERQEKGMPAWDLLIRMEYLEPVRDRIISPGLTVRQAARLTVDLAGALEACSRLGIVHRDIKPDNLFWSPSDGHFKLGDFGIAHYLARPTQGKGRAGTLTHMPPEVYQGGPFTAASDLYALGMVLYRLLNDNRIPFLPNYPEPFTPDERDRALVRRLRGEPVPPPHILEYVKMPGTPCCGLGAQFRDEDRKLADALGTIAARAIAACPEERYGDASALRQAVEQALDVT